MDGWSWLVPTIGANIGPVRLSPGTTTKSPTSVWAKSYDANGRWKRGQLHGSVWMLRFYQNSSGYYLTNAQQLMTVKGKPLDVHGTAAPTIVDLETNSKWHLILGNFGDTLTYFRNAGSREEPVLHTPSSSRHRMDCSNST